MLTPFGDGASFLARPVMDQGLVFLLGGDAEGDAAIERDAFELDVEAIAVLVLPGGTDTGPVAFVAFTVADLVGDVGGSFARGCFVLGHDVVPFPCVSGCDHRGLMAPDPKPLQSGAQRTGPAENWGRPSGGADFPLERTGGGFRRARQEGRCGRGNKSWERTSRADLGQNRE